jgi:hypothetical protein
MVLFEHEWNWYVLSAAAMLVMLTIVARKFRAARPYSGLVYRLSMCLSVPACTFSLYTMGHFACMTIVRTSHRCHQNLKSHSQAQLVYSENHDGSFCLEANWQQVLGQPGALCETRARIISYAVNRGLLGHPTHSLEDPGKTILLFESDSSRLGGRDDLASGRHRGASNYVMTDGRLWKRSPRAIRDLFWTPPLPGRPNDQP